MSLKNLINFLLEFKKIDYFKFYICYVVKAKQSKAKQSKAKQMTKDLINIFIVFMGIWFACLVIASMEDTFVALDLPPFLMSCLMIM